MPGKDPTAAVAALSAVVAIPIAIRMVSQSGPALRRDTAGFVIDIPTGSTWLAQTALLGMALGNIVHRRSEITPGCSEGLHFPALGGAADDLPDVDRFAHDFVNTLVNPTPSPLKGLFG